MKNKELLLKAKESILAEPRHFDMGGWVSVPHEANLWKVSSLHSHPPTECGTTACIAGWIAYHAIKQGLAADDGELIPAVANKALALSRVSTESLYFLDEWPHDLRDEYRTAKRPSKRARIAAERIDRFIAEMEASNAQ